MFYRKQNDDFIDFVLGVYCAVPPSSSSLCASLPTALFGHRPNPHIWLSSEESLVATSTLGVCVCRIRVKINEFKVCDK